MGKIRRIIGCLLLMVLTVNLLPGITTKAESNEENLEVVETLSSNVVDLNIVSTTTITASEAKAWAKKKGATETFIGLADLFWKYSKTNGNVNPAIAYVQSAKETGYGKFGGVIDETYFNTAGIKTPVGGDNLDPNAHHRFKNWDEGVQAHLDHLALYAGADSYPRSTSPDPRHFPYLNGTAKTVKALGAKWATSDQYGVQILNLYYDLLESSDSKPNLVSMTTLDDVKVEGNNLYVRGWAVNKNGVEKINVYVDNNLLGTANYGLERPDVDRIYPGYPNGGLSGYAANFDISAIPEGTKTIKIEQVSSVGELHQNSKTVTISRRVPKMQVDLPIQNESVKNNSLFVKGWALNDSGIKEVKVFIDDKFVGNANYGLSRPDVNKVYPGYPNGENGGYELTVDVRNIASGSRKVVVEAIGFDNVSTKVARTINIPKQAIMQVDSPVQNETIKNNSLFVRGWALNDSGIKEVKVFIDDKFVGNAKYGLSRPDVNKVYPGYPNGDKGGYELTVDVRNIASGSRKVVVEAIGFDNVSTKVERTINIPKTVKKPAIMQVDSPVQNETIKNNSLFVRGWALNDSGIKEVKVFIDDKFVGNANYGLSRPDVNKVYPGYPNGDKGGYELTVDVRNIASGSRKVVVEAIGFDNISTKVERTINIPVIKKPAIMQVDSPTQSEVIESNSLFVRGWALNDSGIKEVKVFIDNKFVGNANYGLSRADVNKVYPGYPNGDKGGYELTVDIKDIASGSRKVVVEAIGFDNVSTKVERTVNITGKKTIVVDAGHNYGGDQGAFATHNGLTYSETEINMLIADKLAKELESRGYNVIMTRKMGEKPTDELNISLAKRVDMANAANADLFISIHQNLYTDSSVNGVEVYYSDAIPGTKGLLTSEGVELTLGRRDIRSTDKVAKSKDLAKSVVDSMSSKLGLHNRGVKNEDFYVVKNTKMPSILIECGFMSNFDDLCVTTSTVKQNEMVKLIADAVKKHF